MTPEQKKEVLRHADGWSVVNLRKYRNTLCDPALIKQLGVPTAERLYSIIMDRPVKIRKVAMTGDYIAEVE